MAYSRVITRALTSGEHSKLAMNVLYLLSHRRQLEQPKKLAGTDVISLNGMRK
jgi:hypothetical protein